MCPYYAKTGLFYSILVILKIGLFIRFVAIGVTTSSAAFTVHARTHKAIHNATQTTEIPLSSFLHRQWLLSRCSNFHFNR